MVRGNRYYWTSATIKSPRDRQQEVGIVLDGRGRKRRRNQHGGGRSINVYNASNQNIISGGVLRGPAPLSLYREVGGTPLASVLRRGRLGIFWWPSSLALRGWFTGRGVLLGILGFRRPPPLPLLASRWGSFGCRRCRRGRARNALLVFAALGTTASSFHG